MSGRMTGMTLNLVEFLRARLDEDAAMRADPYAESAWHARDCEAVPQVLYPELETGTCDCGVPEWLLAEVEAKRKLLEEFSHYEPGDSGYPEFLTAVRLAALSYASHPDYWEEWRL